MKKLNNSNKEDVNKKITGQGLFKKFFGWIAKGAEKSRLEGKSCPT
ncbi:MAG: hypothetical protein JRF40_03970 [Deltaproteobacteria bacterium]|nr:hypothetical protein [Deltaproteobacteria bacterium]MBW2218640.1 hypothetical protein [Deltaproteobacteria bacterium]